MGIVKLVFTLPLLALGVVVLINSVEAVDSDCKWSSTSIWLADTSRTVPTVECHLLNTKSTKFSPAEVLRANTDSCHAFERLTITSEGELILPSQAFANINVKNKKCSHILELTIKAKKGIIMANDTFSGIWIRQLSLRGNLDSANTDLDVVNFDMLDADRLKIEGIKNFDFSKTVRLNELIYKGSSEDQAIVWPKQVLVQRLELTTDVFDSKFGKLSSLRELEVHSLSLNGEPTPVKFLMQTLQSMDLSNLHRLDLRDCYTPDVINLPFKQMPKLAWLMLENNNISHLPALYEDGFGRLNNLAFIDLDGNKIQEIPPHFFDFDNESEKYSRSRSIYLHDNQLQKIGSSAFNHIAYAYMSLADNASVSLGAFHGIDFRLKLYITGYVSITDYPDKSMLSKIERYQTLIQCRNEAGCGSICPTFTTDGCLTNEFRKFEIDVLICDGKFRNFCNK